MDAQVTQQGGAKDSKRANAAAKPGAGSNGSAKKPANGKAQGAPNGATHAPGANAGPPPELYQVHGTVMYRPMKIGDKRLAAAFFKEWVKIHHALHYVTDFSRIAVKGKIVGAANRGISQYLTQKAEEAKHMLDTATEMAESNGVALGQPGSMREQMIEVACPAEKRVLELVRQLDDYIIAVDSLWYEEVMEDERRNDAHAEAVRMIVTMSRLFDRIKWKMIEYRKRQHAVGQKSEDQYARDVELIVLNISGIDISQKKKPASPPQPRAQNQKNDAAAEGTVVPGTTEADVDAKRDDRATASVPIEEAQPA